MLFNGVDASHPGNPLPEGTMILAAYIGATDLPGPPDTPYIWKLADWNLYLDPTSRLFGGENLRVLPIYTHDYPGDPLVDADNAADAAVDLGWSDKLGRFIAWDSEGLSDNTYAVGLQHRLHYRGFRLMTYERSVLQDPACDARWIVNLQGNKPIFLPQGWNGWQWRFGQMWDYDIFDEFTYNNCGQEIRRNEP